MGEGLCSADLSSRVLNALFVCHEEGLDQLLSPTRQPAAEAEGLGRSKNLLSDGLRWQTPTPDCQVYQDTVLLPRSHSLVMLSFLCRNTNRFFQPLPLLASRSWCSTRPLARRPSFGALERPAHWNHSSKPFCQVTSPPEDIPCRRIPQAHPSYSLHPPDSFFARPCPAWHDSKNIVVRDVVCRQRT